MNAIMQDYYPLFEYYQALRSQLLAVLTDQDLGFQPEAVGPSLEELCLRIGQTQESYIHSFQNFQLDFSTGAQARPKRPGVQGLAEWFGELDTRLKQVIAALSDDELENRLVDRGGGFMVSPRFQLEIYKEALLIFYGKTSVYLKVLNKSPGEQWEDWIE